MNVLANRPDEEGKNAATNLGNPRTEPDSVVKENHANRRGKRPKSPSKVAQKQPTQQGNITQGSSLVEASKTTAPRESFTHFLSSVLGSYVSPSHAHAAPIKLASSKPTKTPKITTNYDQSHNHADSATSPDATTTLVCRGETRKRGRRTKKMTGPKGEK